MLFVEFILYLPTEAIWKVMPLAEDTSTNMAVFCVTPSASVIVIVLPSCAKAVYLSIVACVAVPPLIAAESLTIWDKLGSGSTYTVPVPPLVRYQ